MKERTHDHAQDRNTRRAVCREKLLARLGDELARQRRKLPWVRIDREYQFDTDEGTRTLAELFDGRYPILDRAPKGRDEGAA